MSRADKLRRKQKGDKKRELDIRIKEHGEYVAEAAISREYPFHLKTNRRRKPHSEKKTKGSSAKKKRTDRPHRGKGRTGPKRRGLNREQREENMEPPLDPSIEEAGATPYRNRA